MRCGIATVAITSSTCQLCRPGVRRAAAGPPRIVTPSPAVWIGEARLALGAGMVTGEARLALGAGMVTVGRFRLGSYTMAVAHAA